MPNESPCCSPRHLRFVSNIHLSTLVLLFSSGCSFFSVASQQFETVAPGFQGKRQQMIMDGYLARVRSQPGQSQAGLAIDGVQPQFLRLANYATHLLGCSVDSYSVLWTRLCGRGRHAGMKELQWQR